MIRNRGSEEGRAGRSLIPGPGEGRAAALAEGCAGRAWDTLTWETDDTCTEVDPQSLLWEKIKAKEYLALPFF